MGIIKKSTKNNKNHQRAAQWSNTRRRSTQNAFYNFHHNSRHKIMLSFWRHQLVTGFGRQ